jgi:hypothetical protein
MAGSGDILQRRVRIGDDHGAVAPCGDEESGMCGRPIAPFGTRYQ